MKLFITFVVFTDGREWVGYGFTAIIKMCAQ